MIRLIATVTARVFMGSEAASQDRWITLTTDFVLDGIKYAQALRPWPSWLRPFVYLFLPQRLPVLAQLAEGRTFVATSIKAQTDSPVEQPAPLLYHMTHDPKSKEAKNLDAQLKHQMILAVGGIHTTTAVLTQCLYDLVAYPQYIPVLRQEVVEVLKKSGGSWTRQSLGELKKMDSFIREVHRLSSPNLSKSPVQNL
jgi:cytochrome P450